MGYVTERRKLEKLARDERELAQTKRNNKNPKLKSNGNWQQVSKGRKRN